MKIKATLHEAEMAEIRTGAAPDPEARDKAKLVHQHELADNRKVVDDAVLKSKRLGWIAAAFALCGLVGMWLIRFDPYGWAAARPSLLDFAEEMTFLLLGIGAGLSFGGYYSWKIAHRVIQRLWVTAGEAINEVERALAQTRQELFGVIAANVPDDVNPHTAMLVTPRLIEICKALDIAAMRQEIRFADGRPFDTDEAAELGMHTMRAGHPAFSPDEKKQSFAWLSAHNIAPTDVIVSDGSGEKPDPNKTRH